MSSFYRSQECVLFLLPRQFACGGFLFLRRRHMPKCMKIQKTRRLSKAEKRLAMNKKVDSVNKKACSSVKIIKYFLFLLYILAGRGGFGYYGEVYIMHEYTVRGK